MTRNDYNSVAINPDPLQNPHFLPLRFTNMLQNHTLLAGDSIQSTQNILGTEASHATRPYTSPLTIPEQPLGIVTNRMA